MLKVIVKMNIGRLSTFFLSHSILLYFSLLTKWSAMKRIMLADSMRWVQSSHQLSTTQQGFWCFHWRKKYLVLSGIGFVGGVVED